MTVCQTLKAPTQPGSKGCGALRPNNSAGLALTKKRSQMLFSVMMRGVVEKVSKTPRTETLNVLEAQVSQRLVLKREHYV